MSSLWRNVNDKRLRMNYRARHKTSNHLMACSREKDGFFLPLVSVVGLIILTGLTALLARSFGLLTGSIRQGHNQQAREAAESGMAVILKELNVNYPYLLISDCIPDNEEGTTYCTGWTSTNLAGENGTFEFLNSVCPSTITPPETIFSKLSGTLPGGTSSFQLISYDFIGDQQQGGKAVIKVEGRSLYSNSSNITTRAEAFLLQEVNITPKACDNAQGGFPGLLGESVNLGNQDVEGDINGNVICTTCDPNQSQTELEQNINLKKKGVVAGEVFGGQLYIDDPPVFPGFPSDYATTYGVAPCSSGSCDVTTATTITAGQSNGGRCIFDSSKNITHCKVDNILLSGSDVLTIDGTTGTPPQNIQFYVDGDIDTGGNTGIEHAGNSTNFSIFGPKRSESTTCTQNVLIGGTSQSLNAFLHMPDACAGINGGGNADPNFFGAMWVREYGSIGSASNVGNIGVPDDMGSQICIKFGINYCVGIREYAARGSNRWTLLTKP